MIALFVASWTFAGCGDAHGTAAKATTSTTTTAPTTTTTLPRRLTGELELTGQHGSNFDPDGYPPPIREVAAEGFGCRGTDGYDDLKQGVDVVVTDQSNEIIASTSLNTGRMRKVRYEGDNLAYWDCVFTFEVEDLPAASFYGVRVSHRGVLTYSASDLESQGWKVSASLGD